MNLTPEELNHHLIELDGWHVADGRLCKSFNFATYAEGIAFTVQVALMAEQYNHHPDTIALAWKKVSVSYFTHDTGGITQLDTDAARRTTLLSLHV